MTVAVRAVFWVVAYLGVVVTPLVFAAVGANHPDHGFWTNFSVALGFGLDPEGISLELTGTGPAATLDLVPLRLSAEMQPSELPAYARILLDVLRGDATLSIRADEAEESWRIVTPVLEGWSRNLVPLEEYDAGSHCP
jgi:glucose-6-phosphate 1-dehydrogenase